MPKKKSSSVWEAALLKPVCLGCEASSSSVSLSMLKVSSFKTRGNLCT